MYEQYPEWKLLEDFRTNLPTTRNRHFRFKNLGYYVYCRITKHYVFDEMIETFDIGSIDRVDFKHKPNFKTLLSLLEAFATKYALTIYMESVLNDKLKLLLPKLGYIQIGEENIAPNFVKDTAKRRDRQKR